jgi:hypothetical protein
MWPLNKMPNPMGGKRLLDYGCRINYEKTFLVEPRKIEDPDDIRPGTQKGKLDRIPVWVVQIVMPKKLASDIFDGYMTKMKENMGIGRTEGVQAAPAEAADNAQVPAAGAAPTAGAAPAADATAGGTPSV